MTRNDVARATLGRFFLSLALVFSFSLSLSPRGDVVYRPYIRTPPRSMMSLFAQSPFAFHMIHARTGVGVIDVGFSKRGRAVIVTGQIRR